MDDSIYQDLPEEPELAFLHLEQAFHTELLAEEKDWGSDGPPASAYIEYMAKTLAAANELGLDLFGTMVPPDSNIFTHGRYLDFRHQVVQHRTSLQIRTSKRSRQFSVRLDIKAKKTIHFYIAKIRDLILATPLEEQKKERLIDKLVAFESEVDRDRTRLQSFGAAFVEFAGVLGDAAKELEPARGWLDSIAGLIWGAKEDENKRLPSPPTRKHLEPPKKGAPSGSQSLAAELDDDIPF